MAKRERIRREYYESVGNIQMLWILDRIAVRYGIASLKSRRICDGCGLLNNYNFVLDHVECPNGCDLGGYFPHLSVEEYTRRETIALNESYL